MEVNPVDVAGVRIRYRLGNAEFSIAMFTLYQLLLLNPQRGCAVQSGLREWERFGRLTDTWAANTPCWASLGEFVWEGGANEEILLSSCGLSPPIPGNPCNPKSPPPPPKCKSFKSGSSSSSDRAPPRGHGKALKGKQPQQQKQREEPPSLE